VRVSAAPVEGMANERVARILAHELDVPHARLILISGARSRNKDALVRGAAARHAQLTARFTELQAPPETRPTRL
jgi:uncharacterized protein YggU (UPF0235/DUF167 family)